MTPPVVDIPRETEAPPEPEPAQIATEPVEAPPFDPDNPQPGQSVRAFVPHSGYTSFAYGTQSFDVDPDTDCII